MPPKTFTCDICKEQVSKRKSVATSLGKRICKHHDEAECVVEKRVKAETAKKEEAKQKQEQREARRSPTFFTEQQEKFNEFANNHCWSCGVQGITEQIFYTRMMIAMEKAHIKDGEHPNFFSNEGITRIREEANLKELEVLLTIRTENTEHIYQFIKHKMRQLAQMIQAVQLCVKCTEKRGMKQEYEKQKAERMPKFNKDTLATMMTVSSLMKPGLRNIALTEINQELLKSEPRS